MAYRLLKNEPVDVGIKRIVGEQIDRAIEEIDEEEIDPHETVHQVRKRCKKIRAMLRLVRPAFEQTYDDENAWYRDAARKLSDVRDAQSRIECYDELMEHFHRQVNRQQFASVRGALTRRRNEVAQIQERLDTLRSEMLEGRNRVAAWPLEGEDFDVLAGGLGKTYRRGRRAMRAAYRDTTPESFHEWRKRTKYHWYHVRVLRDVWSPVMRRHCDEIDRLGGYLGDDHDLAILRQMILSNPREFGDQRDVQALAGLIDRRRTELEANARPLGDRVFAESTRRFVERMRAYWEAWRAETASSPALAEESDAVEA
jgi:CHAD domain-containing protein